MVLGLLELLLGLAELGQVEGGDLLSLPNLLLVGLDLLLELASQVRHTVLALLVLVILELELLDLALGPLVSLHVLTGLGLDIAELDLKLPDAGLELGHGGPASPHGGIVGISQTVFELSQAGLKGPLALAQAGGVVLLRAELIRQAGGVNHGLLGLLLGVLGLVQEVVNLCLHGVQRALHTPLVSSGAGVDGAHFIDGAASISQLSLSLPLATLSGVKESPGLLNLTLEGVGPAVSEAGLLGHLLPHAASLLVGTLGLTVLALVSLDGLQGLVVGLVSVVQSNLELIDVRLELLLDPETLGLVALLSLKGSLEGLHGTAVVLASVVELLLLLGDLPVDLLLDLSKLKLGPQHLVLLSLQSSLELLLLGLEPPALFVQLVDGAASIAKLVKEILDLISEVLVLAADNVQLLIGLIQGSLETESLGIEVAALRVAGIKLSHQVISLGLPLSDNLVKVAAALLGDHGGGVGPLVLHGELLQLIVHPGLRFLSGGNLGVEGLNDLLSLLDAGGELVTTTLELVNASKSLDLILGLPELDP